MNRNMQTDGKRLIDEGERIFRRDVKGALEDGDYNLTVRRAQEVVELVLKGALKVLCVEYPRIHDVGTLFAEQVREKRQDVETEGLDRIEEISLWLSQARAPALYFEREYDVEDARQALQDAAFVVVEVKKRLDIRNEDPSERVRCPGRRPDGGSVSG